MTTPLRSGHAALVAVTLAAAGYVTMPALAHATPFPLDGRPADAANLVANADFHHGMSGWGTHVFHAGIGGHGANLYDNGYVGQDVPVNQGASYTFSVQAGPNAGGSVIALALDSHSGVQYVARTVNAPTTVTSTFIALGPTVYIACQASGRGGWCDNFSVVSAPNAGLGSSNTGSN
ncbi:hypothetical protein [Nocardia alni]|uniref:hypothetical protein n=1 Tax=Nocardia alni TaxID=2815723 RepID=UPI001C228805|nr:hypothetical protein [Nocardia alni]